MMFIPLKVCPNEKANDLRRINASQPEYYTGHLRGFMIVDGAAPEEVWIDTRHDEELRAAGLIK